jgi:hypothetical protein
MTPGTIVTSLTAVVLSMALSAPASADSSISGKTIGLFAGSGVNPGTMGATILKGKKKHVLVIDVKVTLADTSGAEVSVYQPTVNGLGSVQPIALSGITTTKCGVGGSGCSVSGTYWFDIDAAEVALPGTFYNHPLNVSINIAVSNPSAATSTSMVVKMEKK